MKNQVFLDDDLQVLKGLKDGSVTLIYMRPPEEIGNLWRLPVDTEQRRSITIGSKTYTDLFDKYLEFLEPRLAESHRILSAKGTIYFHATPEKAHYCKALLLDEIFHRDNFLNEAIWVYSNSQSKPQKKWPEKHDNILVYVKDLNQYIFNTSKIVRLDYMAPKLVGRKKQLRGKLPTDTWFEELIREGLPNQIITASSNPNDLVVQLFAIDGSLGEACLKSKRKFILIANNEVGMSEIAKSLGKRSNIEWFGFTPPAKGK